jgi:DNA polymerase III delta prime subunit
MHAETYRPTFLNDVVGHSEVKESLKKYLTSNFSKSILLSGPPGIGKTTLALCAARTFGFDPLEINASRNIRSFEDVEKIKDACRSAINIHSFLLNQPKRRTCVILDEVDGSDPHAQTKIIAWIKDPLRKVPIICTGNELPTIFKRNSEYVELIRCFPPRAIELQPLFKDIDISVLLKECQYDVRRMMHRIQFGTSDVIPKYNVPPTGLPIETMFIMRQKMFGLEDPLHEYHVGKRGNEHSLQTN